MSMLKSSNPIVANAIDFIAMNMPRSGNLYKCPHCGTMRRFSMDGKCEKCRRKLSGSELGKFLTERITRGVRSETKSPIRGLAKSKYTGSIDLHPSDAKHMMKHPGSIKRIGMTLAKGEYGPTTVGSRIGSEKSKKRVSIVHGKSVVFTEKDDHHPGSSRITTEFKGADAAKREKIIHKETRRR